MSSRVRIAASGIMIVMDGHASCETFRMFPFLNVKRNLVLPECICVRRRNRRSTVQSHTAVTTLIRCHSRPKTPTTVDEKRQRCSNRDIAEAWKLSRAMVIGSCFGEYCEISAAFACGLGRLSLGSSVYLRTGLRRSAAGLDVSS